MRIAHTWAGLMLVGAMAAACGGDGSDAPDDASKKEFCVAVQAAPSDGKPSQDEVDEWVDELKDAGTPGDIDDDARQGYEVLVEALDDADVDDLDEGSTIEDVVEDEDDRKDVEDFFAYFAETCMGTGGRLPTEFPTDLLTEFPSDLPTDVES